MTFRRLLKVILPNLPRESAFKRSIDPAGAAWSRAEYILADVYDALSAANWQRANEGNANPSKQPKPYPRPGDVVVEQSEREQLNAALIAQGERTRAAEVG